MDNDVTPETLRELLLDLTPETLRKLPYVPRLHEEDIMAHAVDALAGEE